jgi:hypothetical protein
MVGFKTQFYQLMAVNSLLLGWQIIRGRKILRGRNYVLKEYGKQWEKYGWYLDKAKTLDDWLFIKGVEDLPYNHNHHGSFKKGVFDSGAYYRVKLYQTIKEHFPTAGSVTEYGCGVGRNLLYLKKVLPHLQVYGYELCNQGVLIARRAATKFGLSVKISELDYINDSSSRYIFPNTDLAFTMFSLEQLPDQNKLALVNILDHVHLGSIHLEPVPENYPYTFRGLLGRFYSSKANYLKNFDHNVRSLTLTSMKSKLLDTSHNPVMYPTIYVLKK